MLSVHGLLETEYIDPGRYFPRPFIEQMFDRLAGWGWYSFLDSYLAYNQITITPKDQEKTTFSCTYGTYVFRCMLFGLCNDPSIFQRCIMLIFSDMVEDTIKVFMDDFAVVGDTFEDCPVHLANDLCRCEECNLVLN